MSISFKDSEQDLYDRIVASSCSPTAFIKDVLIDYFKKKDAEEKEKRQPVEVDDIPFL